MTEKNLNSAIRLIVGLGNPGPEYELTRHNAGFWLVDHFVDDLHTSFNIDKSFFAWFAKARHDGKPIFIAKPNTYMNKSGLSVGAIANFFKLKPQEILVCHDELDLLPGTAKLKLGGGHAGHNGLKDIQAALGTPNFWRLRIGIGHPRSFGLTQPVVKFVLQAPRKDDMAALDDVINRSRVILPQLLDGEFDRATERLHQGNHG